MVSNYLQIHSKDLKAIIKRIKAQKQNICAFMTPDEGGQGINLTGFTDSLHMVSHYLPMHSKPLKAIKEVRAKDTTSAILL